MRIVSVVGARPQFVKLAPISRAMAGNGIEHIIVHTGQHYDPNMSESFFEILDIPKPEFNLAIGSGSHGRQTGDMLVPLEKIMANIRPDWILAYGDTNSTLATSLVAAKSEFKLAHLEAGLRSFNRKMPEEINRIVTDHVSDLLLAPTQIAMKNLSHEGLAEKSVLVGDVMTDICLQIGNLNSEAYVLPAGVKENEYYLATIHRAENTDSRNRLAQVVEVLSAMDFPVILTAHPRLLARAKDHSISLEKENIILVDPLSYPEMISAAMHARAVVTDSGGLQKESFLVGTPCVTLRSETEWIETVELGVNLVGEQVTAEVACNFVAELLPKPWPTEMPYGSGNSAERVVEALQSTFEM